MAHIVFIDIRNAFDSLHRSTLTSKLRRKGAKGNKIDVRDPMYERSQSVVPGRETSFSLSEEESHF